MASAAGLIGWPGAVGYVAAKHGVVGLTKAAALEYATEGIRVNSICPSYAETPMVSDLFENILGGDAAAVEAARANHPIGRFAQAPGDRVRLRLAAVRQGLVRHRHGDERGRGLHRSVAPIVPPARRRPLLQRSGGWDALVNPPSRAARPHGRRAAIGQHRSQRQR